MGAPGDKRAEFFKYVWNHSEDVFQTAFDERRPLSEQEQALLSEITARIDAGESDEQVAGYLRQQLIRPGSEKLIEVVLQVCGITRNKILQDIKAAASAERRSLRLSSHLSLAAHVPTWLYAGLYLAKKLRRVLEKRQGVTEDERMFEALNQATWPGYIRQERAKRSGHEAEYRIATLLSACKLKFVPVEKADNPLCRDAIFNGVSFDIVIPDLAAPRICVKSTVHTSNIGQYGESKDALEVSEARRMIDDLPQSKRPLLVGFIDGVGFESNSAGLNGVLAGVDEFCQFSTIWKLVVLGAESAGKVCELYLPEVHRAYFADFLAKHAKAIVLLDEPPLGGIPAGDGVVVVR